MPCRESCEYRYPELAGDGTKVVYRCEVTEQIIDEQTECPLC
jgi:hypothetical protein